MTTLLTEKEMLTSRLRELPFDRKPSSFHDVINSITVTQEEWDSIPHMFPADPDFYPGSELPGTGSDWFLFILHMVDGNTYLVNTEGFNYCRYVIKCTLAPKVKYQIIDTSCGVPDDDTLYDTYDAAVNAVLESVGVMIVEESDDECDDE